MGASKIVAVVDGVEVLEAASRVFVVAPDGVAVVVGGRAKRRPVVVVSATAVRS